MINKVNKLLKIYKLIKVINYVTNSELETELNINDNHNNIPPHFRWFLMVRLSREFIRYINQNNNIIQNIIPLIHHNDESDNVILFIVGLVSLTLMAYIIKINNESDFENKDEEVNKEHIEGEEI